MDEYKMKGLIFKSWKLEVNKLFSYIKTLVNNSEVKFEKNR